MNNAEKIFVKTAKKVKLTSRQVMLFWKHVDKTGGSDSCWPWNGYRDDKGYGRCSAGKAIRFAHRISYSMATGDDSFGRPVCHKCDNPPCVNPKHLYSGTPKLNTQDAIRRKRLATGIRHGSKTHPERLARGARHGTRIHPPYLPKGEKVWSAKLTPGKIKKIKSLYESGFKQKWIGGKFSVSQTCISKIVNGLCWKHI